MYSKDFKKRATAYKDAGHSFQQLRKVFGIASRTYYRWKEEEKNGWPEGKTKKERKRKIDKKELKRAVTENPDAYLRELAQIFSCSAVAIFYALKKLKITLKKNIYLQRKIGNRTRKVPRTFKKGSSQKTRIC
jgi:transposase-like protein